MKARYIVATEGIVNVAGVYIAPGALQGPLNGDTIPVYNEDKSLVVGQARDLKRNPNTGEVSIEIEFDPKNADFTFSGTKCHFSVTDTVDSEEYIELRRAQIGEVSLLPGDIYETKIKAKDDE